jgi:release factor glutamine methyltransferase
VEFVEGSWLAAVAQQRFDLIVSNPPYIAAGDAHLRQGDLRFEPHSALAAGADGLDDIRLIVAAAGPHLRDGAWLLLEHGFDQGGAVRALLEAAGFANVATWQDLCGLDRVSGGRWNA